MTGLFVGFASLGLFFSVAEWRWRGSPGTWFRRLDLRTDLAYWLFTPLATRALARIGVGIAVLGDSGCVPRFCSRSSRSARPAWSPRSAASTARRRAEQRAVGQFEFAKPAA